MTELEHRADEGWRMIQRYGDKAAIYALDFVQEVEGDRAGCSVALRKGRVSASVDHHAPEGAPT